MAQARIKQLTFLPKGIAFLRWSPLWQPSGQPLSRLHLRKCLDGIYAEFVVRRRLFVRLIPCLYSEDAEWVLPLLQEAGFRRRASLKPRRTIIMNLQPSLDDIHTNLHCKWRAHLKRAKRRNQRVVEGQGDDLFDAFEAIYRRMRARKKFVTFTDFQGFRRLNARLAPPERMTAILAGAESDLHSGAIVSPLGRVGLYLFGATDGQGLESNGSYVVQWRAVELLKARGCTAYDLNGIDPDVNPTTYQYKSRLAGKDGREVAEVGGFEACLDPISWLMGRLGLGFLNWWRAGRLRRREQESNPKPLTEDEPPTVRK